LQLDRHPGLESDPKPRPGRLFDRAVRPERQQVGREPARREVLLGQPPRARAGVAPEPRSRAQLLDGDLAALGERVVGRSDQHDWVLGEVVTDETPVVGDGAWYWHDV